MRRSSHGIRLGLNLFTKKCSAEVLQFEPGSGIIEAEAILMDARRNFNPEEPKVMNGDILFADYMEKWLDIIKNSVAVPTFASYSTTVKKIVAPYFRKKK